MLGCCDSIRWDSCEARLPPGGAFPGNPECASKCLSGKSGGILVQGKWKEDEGGSDMGLILLMYVK